jgi:predicted SprT family Zn-dependent metalloprotease
MDSFEVQKLAWSLMETHGLTVKGWTFLFDRSTRRLGICRFNSKRIQVSRPLAEVNSVETVRDTLLHEIAHALVGPAASHGAVWKLQAQAIGARPVACAKLTEVIQVETAWQAVCQDCGVKVSRTRAPNLARGYWHGECRYKANKGKIVWHYHGRPVSSA